MRRDVVSLLDILLSARLAVEFVGDVDFEQFLGDRRTQDAVIRRLEILGEASRRISAQFKSEHPQLPWHEMIGLRNRLIHEYEDIDLEIVWDVVVTELPSLISQLEPLIPPDSDE